MNVDRITTAIATKVYRRYFPYILAVASLPEYLTTYRKYHAVGSIREGFSDHRNQQIRVSDRVLERLIRAYRLAKVDQVGVSKSYRVGHLWQEIIDTRFKSLTDALSSLQLSKVRAILENFNREDCGDDTCGGGQYYRRMRDIPFYKYQYINAWYRRYSACATALGREPGFNQPLVGNPVGMLKGVCIVPLCNLEYRYYAEKVKSLLRGVPNLTVCEIGGGVGGQAYEILRNNTPLNYILLDIPEVLLLSSYFLIASLPDRRFLLYGEDRQKHRAYDIALLPNFVLPQLADMSVDLFFNSCSLSEMDYCTAEEYTRQIERVGKTYFLHINHNARLVWHNGENRITNMIADEVVPRGFDRIYKEPRMFSLLEDKFVIQLFYRERYYEYLYQRRI